MDADVSQIVDLAVDLDRIAGGVGANVAKVVRKSAADVEAHAKARTPVDTGYLRSSIGSDHGRDGNLTYSDIGPTANYGSYVEFGTHRAGPQPYMMPAADKVAPSFVAGVEAVMKL